LIRAFLVLFAFSKFYRCAVLSAAQVLSDFVRPQRIE
jgi:hypothetical protein